MGNRKCISFLAVASIICSLVMCIGLFITPFPEWILRTLGVTQMVLVFMLVYKRVREMKG